MNTNNDVEGWCLFGLGVLMLVIALGVVGGLFSFLYDVSIYLVVGFVVVAFVATLVFMFQEYKEHGQTIRGNLAEALSEFRGQMSHIEEGMRRTNKSIEGIKTGLDQQSKLCEKAIEKAEALLNPKPPVPIPLPEPTPPEEEQMQDAIEEVVGGAL